MLHVILLEAAVELVPPELSAKKLVQKQAYRRKKKPTEILLDQTYHGQAMTQLKDGTRRGRPDIVFFCLQSLLETPLCKAGLMTVHIQLYDGRIIQVDPAVRIPRNYERFVGLMEQLLQVGQVPPEGAPLLKVQDPGLGGLISSLKGSSKDSLALLAVEGGKQTGLNDLLSALPSSLEAPVILGIGAFPHGDFQHDMQSLFDIRVELDRDVMMAWHVCAEALWMYSLKHNVVSERYSSAQ